jgi:hypothetical protein
VSPLDFLYLDGEIGGEEATGNTEI